MPFKEFMLELKMNALKSILEKTNQNEENSDESKLSKNSSRKIKKKKNKQSFSNQNNDEDVQVIYDKREQGLKRKLSSKAKKKSNKKLDKLGRRKSQSRDQEEEDDSQNANDDDIIEITSNKFYERNNELKIDTYNSSSRYMNDNYNLESMDIEPLGETAYNNNFSYNPAPTTSSYPYQPNYPDSFNGYNGYDQYNPAPPSYFDRFPQPGYNYDAPANINMMANFLSQFNANPPNILMGLAEQIMQTGLLMPQQQIGLSQQQQRGGGAQQMKPYNKNNIHLANSSPGLLPTPSPLLNLKLTPPSSQMSPSNNNNNNNRPNLKNVMSNTKLSPGGQQQRKQNPAQNKKQIFSPGNQNNNINKNNIQIKTQANSPKKQAQNKPAAKSFMNNKFKNLNKQQQAAAKNKSTNQAAVSNEKPNSPKVIFTLSSPSTVSLTSPASSISAKTISPASDTNKEDEASEKFGFVASGIDVDERFIDKTTNNLDVDYRQPSLEAKQDEKVEEKSETETEKEEEEEEEEEEEKKVNEEEILQLRMKLIDTLNKKKKLQEEQQKQEEKVQEKKLEQDISILKQKLMKDEEDLIKTNLKESSSAPIIKPDTSMSNKKPVLNQSMSFINLNKPKISPVIIHLNSNETDDEDEDDENEDNVEVKSKTSPKEMLKSNIDLFLKEAKELAVSSLQPSEVKKSQPLADNSLNRSIGHLHHSNSSSLENKPASRSVGLTKQNSDVEKMIQKAELEKKDIIKSLRDKIISKR